MANRRVTIISACTGEPIRPDQVWRYESKARLQSDAEGAFEIPATGWQSLNVHLAGDSDQARLRTSPVIPPGDADLVLVLDHDGAGFEVREVEPPAPPPGDGLKPRPGEPPAMGFTRTEPPTNLDGGSLITLAGTRTFVGFAYLKALSDRRITPDGLRTCMAAVHTVGGNMFRVLRNLGVKNRRDDFVHSVHDAAEHRARLRACLEEGRPRGVYLEYPFTDEPERNDPHRRGEGYSREDNSLDGESRLTVDLMRRMTNREIARYGQGGPDAELGKALLIEIGNEPHARWLDNETNGRIYDELGKYGWSNRWTSNANHDPVSHNDGTPIFVHMDSQMPRETSAIIERLQAVRRASKGKPVVLDFDGSRMHGEVPGQDFGGLDNYLEIVEVVASDGFGVIGHLTDPYRPWEPFAEIELPAPFGGKRRGTTLEFMQMVADAARRGGGA